MNIVCATDDNYSQHCAVMMCSVLENSKQPQNIVFYILVIEQLKDENVENLKQVGARYGAPVQFVILPKKYFEKLPYLNHLTMNAYSRLFFPDIFPNINKIIYLDSDVVVETDIEELWNRDMNGKVVSAVYDVALGMHYKWFGFKNAKYFNSGVMLIDTKMYRKLGLQTKLVDFLIKNKPKIGLGDQDALDYLLYKDWDQMGLEWNVTGHLFEKSDEYPKEYKNELKFAQKNPKIIHFTPRWKPTNYFCDHPLASRYFYYLNLTPYKFFKIPNKTIPNFFYKWSKKLIPQKLKNIIISSMGLGMKEKFKQFEGK